jgi:hypothetical protein
MDMGGGGAGGQVIARKAYDIPVGVPLPVVVGRGGYGAPAGGGGYRTDGAGPQPAYHQFTISATDGVASSFAGIVAAGGAYGGSSYFGYTPNNGYGGNGFNGGGSSGYSDGSAGRAGTGNVAAGGYNGGGASGQYYSGGGAGSGGPGISGSAQPHGGPGIYDDITGTGYYWGGGGGGAAYSLGTGGNGGAGGGGGGAVGTTTGGSGYNAGSAGGGGSAGSQTNTPGGNGGTNTGGGGGGGSHYNLTNKGGEGGSGIVVIRYPGPQKGFGGNIITTVGSDTVHIFTTSGTFILSESVNTRTSDNNILSWAAWVDGGTDGITGYSQNGAAGENGRRFGYDPYGNYSVIWESRPNGSGNDDGGWNTSWFNIDKTKKYRYSVWVRRITGTSGGTFYMGMYANGTGAKQLSDNVVNGNPYWICSGTGSLTQNQWYLVVGHVYPHETTYTGKDPESGLWTREGGYIGATSCNIGSGDLKWPSDATQGLHRTYHYYCGDATTRLEFFQPRVDACDGTEPSISELLSGDHQSWKDNSMNGYRAYMSNLSSANLVTVDGIKAWETSDVNNQGFRIPNFQTPGSGGRTYEVWLKSKSFALGWQTWVDDGGERILFGTSSNAVQMYPDLSFAANLVANTWYQIVYTLSGGAGSTCVAYVNGEQIGTGTFTSALSASPQTLMLLGDFGTEVTSCYCSMIRMYDRALTPTQVKDNFNAHRGRHGI